MRLQHVLAEELHAALSRLEARAGPSVALGREALQPPGLAFTGVAEAVVEAVRTVLPELEARGCEEIAAPPERQGRVVPVGGLRLGEGPVEHLAAGDDRGLPGRPGAQPAPERARAEVRLGLLARERRDRPGDRHLSPWLLGPVEDERGVRVLGQLASFPAFRVREEPEAVLRG